MSPLPCSAALLVVKGIPASQPVGESGHLRRNRAACTRPGRPLRRLASLYAMRLALLRRLQGHAVASVDAVDGAVGMQPLHRAVHGLAQLLVRAEHADRDIPTESGLAVIERQD